MMADLETLFPGLCGTEYLITSPSDSGYNCIAWAAGDQSRWWWPDATSYWPFDEYRWETIACLLETFRSSGFSECDALNDDGADYIALYTNDDGCILHAARRLPNGRWTSKLGELVDIEHDLRALEGAQYGKVTLLLTRQRTS